MKTEQAAEKLEALGNQTRLDIFRFLIQAGTGGSPVGAIQQSLNIPASTLSHHISRLMRVGLVSQERRSRVLICRAEFQEMNNIISFLTENCCAGNADQSCEIDSVA